MGTNKDSKLARFQKFQVLMAAALNKSLRNVGSVMGLLPYDENLEIDKFMQFDIGAKESPFGNIFAKGLNVFTTAEILSFVDAGLLTNNDKMPFVNTNDGQWYLWNGSQIVPMGGQGGGTGMDYLYGDGSDGNITAVSNSNFTKTYYQFNNFTLNAGVTWGSTVQGPIILSVKGTCTLSGIVNLTGKGSLGGIASTTYGGGQGGRGSGNIMGMGYGGSALAGGAGGGLGRPDGEHGNSLRTGSSGPFFGKSLMVFTPTTADANFMRVALKSGLLFTNPLCGGGGGGAGMSIAANNYIPSTSSGGGGAGTGGGGGGGGADRGQASNTLATMGAGGAGGGSLIIYANELIVNNTFSFIGTGATGGSPSGTNVNYCVGGGGGGGGGFMAGYKSGRIEAHSFSAAGGAGGSATYPGNAGAAGIEAFVQMQ